MNSLKSVEFGGGAFALCTRVVFESSPPSLLSLNRLISVEVNSVWMEFIHFQERRFKHTDYAKYYHSPQLIH